MLVCESTLQRSSKKFEELVLGRGAGNGVHPRFIVIDGLSPCKHNTLQHLLLKNVILVALSLLICTEGADGDDRTVILHSRDPTSAPCFEVIYLCMKRDLV